MSTITRASLAALLMTAASLPTRAADDKPAAEPATLVVRLPAGATLTVGDAPTRQTGPERTFVSPPLTPGKSYFYELKATWQENGKTKTVTREAGVAAGKRTVIDLTAAEAPAEPKKRTFRFTYAATVTGLKPGEKARVWLPVPPSNEDQQVRRESVGLPDGPATTRPKEGKDPQYGNAMLYFEAAADKDGNMPFRVVYRVTRREVKEAEKDTTDDALVKRFLQPDKLVPIDGKPLELLKGRALPRDRVALARVLYDVVDDHMTYDKSGAGWGRGDAVWACESGQGNCTDFHSLFISLARANKIPVKFEMGFGLPPQRGGGDIAGYHCWAKFRVEGKGWVPVDISEANKDPKMRDYYFGNLTEDRVAFSTGRDITLSPKQDGEPLNYFIYPYVEVGGKPYPADRIQRKFSYKDVQ